TKRQFPVAKTIRIGFGVLAMMLPCFAPAQQDTLKGIERYRQLLQESNPAELYEPRGAEHWKGRRGPKNASLEQCDLGLGPGVVKGAYAGLPRYFADTDRVLDLESRLVGCMVKLQGFTEAEAQKNPFGNGNAARSDLEALTAYVTSESRGVKMNVPMRHPKEIEAYRVGEKIFDYRGGTH